MPLRTQDEVETRIAESSTKLETELMRQHNLEHHWRMGYRDILFWMRDERPKESDVRTRLTEAIANLERARRTEIETHVRYKEGAVEGLQWLILP